MTNRERVAGFRDEESGAVTVDWVVLTAALVLLAVGALAAVSGSTEATVENIETGIISVDPAG